MNIPEKNIIDANFDFNDNSIYVCYNHGIPVGYIKRCRHIDNMFFAYTIKQLTYYHFYGLMNNNEIITYLDEMANNLGTHIEVDDEFHPIGGLYNYKNSIIFNCYDVSCVCVFDTVDRKNQIEQDIRSLMRYVYNTDFLENFQVCGFDFESSSIFNNNIRISIQTWMKDTDLFKRQLIKWFDSIGVSNIEVLNSKYQSYHDNIDNPHLRFNIDLRFPIGQIKRFKGNDILPKLTKIVTHDGNFRIGISHFLITNLYNLDKTFFDEDSVEHINIDKLYHAIHDRYCRVIFRNGEFYHIDLCCECIQGINVELLRKKFEDIIEEFGVLQELCSSSNEKVLGYNVENLVLFRNYTIDDFAKKLSSEIIRILKEKVFEINSNLIGEECGVLCNINNEVITLGVYLKHNKTMNKYNA